MNGLVMCDLHVALVLALIVCVCVCVLREGMFGECHVQM